MNYKRGLFVLLAGAVLLVPVTSHYAITLDEIKNKVSSFFSEDTFKKILPVFAITLAAGLYYWWTRGGGSGSGGEKPTSIIEQKMSSVPFITQFQVYSQFERDGGGGASCGYQTLLRGMQVIRDKAEHEEGDNFELEKTLMDSMPIAVYFGPDGEWRKDIIKKRKNQELKKILHEKLLTAFTPHGDNKAIELYKSSLGFLEDIIIVQAKDPNYSFMPYDFTDEAIQKYLKKGLDQLKNKNNEILIEKLEEPNEIAQYFDFEIIRKMCLSEDFILTIPKLNDELNQRKDLQEDFRGEWLSDGELEYLWEEHKYDIIPINVNCGFKAIANFELVDNPQYPKEFDEVAVYIDENVKPFLNKKEQMFRLFGLGTMRQTGETSGTRGHWYPLVMHQDYKGKLHYYVMDSAANHSRLRDTNVWKIINLIEKSASKDSI